LKVGIAGHNLEVDRPRTIPPTFGLNWPGGFRGEDILVIVDGRTALNLSDVIFNQVIICGKVLCSMYYVLSSAERLQVLNSEQCAICAGRRTTDATNQQTTK
jgi:hypothetical protein